MRCVTIRLVTDWLTEYPLDWTNQRLREFRDALSATLVRDRDVEMVVVEAGVPAGNLNWNQPTQMLWYAAINEAAAQLRTRQFLAAVARRSPALAKKAEELSGPRPLVDEQDTTADPQWRNFGEERQIVKGMETMLDVSFLQHGLDRAPAVCRLSGLYRRDAFNGTGFRVGKRTLLTNHHVLYDKQNQPAVQVKAEFGYEVDVDGMLRIPVEVTCDVTSIAGARDHDFAVIRTAEDMPDVPVLPIRNAPTVRMNDRVYIIQHPKGLPKKIALEHNLVRFADDDLLQYWTDTERGSSGSPVFDASWRVVGLHHRWVESNSGDGVAFRNQGRAINRVVERLDALGIDFEG